MGWTCPRSGEGVFAHATRALRESIERSSTHLAERLQRLSPPLEPFAGLGRSSNCPSLRMRSGSHEQPNGDFSASPRRMTRGVFRERDRYSRKPIAWTSRQRGPVRSWISASRSPGPPSDVRLVHGCRGWIAGKPCRASCPVGCLSPLSPMYVGLRRTVSHQAAYRSGLIAIEPSNPPGCLGRPLQGLATRTDRRQGVLHERLAEAPPFAVSPSRLDRWPVRSRASARTMRGPASREPDPPSRRVPQESLRESSPARFPRFDRRRGRLVRSDESGGLLWTPCDSPLDSRLPRTTRGPRSLSGFSPVCTV